MALGSQRRGWGTARAPPVCMPAMTLGRRACIGTHHPRRPHRCVRGALNGAIASACAAVHRAPNHDRAPPPFPRPSKAYAEPVAKLLFESQAERSRPWFAQVPASVRDLAFSLQSYAAAGIRRAEVRLSMHCSQSAACRSACSAAHGGRGRGALVGAAPLSPSTRPLTPRPPLGHITPAVGPD